jgi:hypothetical protein
MLVHPMLKSLADRFEYAERACRANATECAESFGEDHPYRICHTRIGNKARYALDAIECYSHRIPADKASLTNEEAERLIETQKWYLISVLSVLEYSMHDLLAGRGSEELRRLARDGGFGKFLTQAVSERAIGEKDRDYLAFMMRVRNDIIHLNGNSRESASLTYEGKVFELHAGTMIEGDLYMLADLGSLAVHLASSVIHHMEENLNAPT